MIPLTLHAISGLLVSLLPVIVFLIALVLLDSYKLVRPLAVLGLILLGCAIAFSCLWLNRWLMQITGNDMTTYARYVGPVLEEGLKALFIFYLVRRRRVGFMVDAAIYGFAIGAGFAIIENIYYFRFLPEASLLLWIVRGFGTAVMHGGATAIVGILSKYFTDRFGARLPFVYPPGLLLAIVIHSVFNHFFISPVLETLALLVVLPLLMWLVFRVSERGTRRWLGVRFDTDAELLEMIHTGRVSESRVGEYLQSLKTRFSGEMVVDMLCMLRLHLELSIQAKGILLMRQAGFNVPPEPEVVARLEELKYLEKSIGKTGLMAISPIFNMSDHDLWQLYMLGKR